MARQHEQDALEGPAVRRSLASGPHPHGVFSTASCNLHYDAAASAPATHEEVRLRTPVLDGHARPPHRRPAGASGPTPRHRRVAPQAKASTRPTALAAEPYLSSANRITAETRSAESPRATRVRHDSVNLLTHGSAGCVCRERRRLVPPERGDGISRTFRRRGSRPAAGRWPGGAAAHPAECRDVPAHRVRSLRPNPRRRHPLRSSLVGHVRLEESAARFSSCRLPPLNASRSTGMCEDLHADRLRLRSSITPDHDRRPFSTPTRLYPTAWHHRCGNASFTCRRP